MAATHQAAQRVTLIANKQRLKTIREKYGRYYVGMEKLMILMINDNQTSLDKNYLLSDS